jgi:hypothetical protein
LAGRFTIEAGEADNVESERVPPVEIIPSREFELTSHSIEATS